MPKQPSKTRPSSGRLEVEVDPEGFSVFVSFRDEKTGNAASLKLHRSAAAALRSLLTSSERDDDERYAVILRGELEIKEKEPNARTPAIPCA